MRDQIDIPEPACEPPAGFYVDIPDDSTKCSVCDCICADEANNELGLALETCWQEKCQYWAVMALKAKAEAKRG